MRTVLCPYCGEPAKLTDSAVVYGGRSYGMIWLCADCDAYVGVHKTGGQKNQPLGTLANAELRPLRRRCHELFDPMWKNSGRSRRAAYKWLAAVMGLEPKDAHISMFNAEQCRRLIQRMTAPKRSRSA